MSSKPVVTDELLQHAWRDVRRPGWGSFEASLADPVRGGLIRARAAQLAHQPRAPPPPAPTEARGSWPFALRHTTTRPPTTDAKRAAAGDTDDLDDDSQESPTPCPP